MVSGSPPSLQLPEPMRQADITIRLSEFEIPPMQDVLLVGRRAIIGPEAIRRMVDALSPEQYEVIRTDHHLFEAVVLKKSLTKMMPRDKLLAIILDEGERVATEDTVVKAQVNIVIKVKRAVDI